VNDMTIGQLAEKAEVKVSTIRYYERRRLLAEPPRGDSGYRRYTRDAVARIQFIRHAQGLGFTLRDIRELLALRVSPEATCGDVKHAAEVKLIGIQAKIRSLQRMKHALRKLVSACDGQSATAQCPIIEALETEETNDGRVNLR
jgi:MerR family transcriptional regulator, copper efflux regulator